MAQPAVGVVLVGFLFVGVPFLLVGVAFLRRGLDHLGTTDAFQALPRRTVADIQAGERAKLVGRAEAATAPGDERLVGAFTGTPALAVRYEVDEYRPDGDGGTDRHRIHDARDAVPFRLVDDEGSVAVDPDPGTVAWSDRHRERVLVRKGEEPPERVRAYVATVDALDPAAPGASLGPFNFGGRRRTYVESAIRPGDEVVVVGAVERDPDAPWGDSLVVRPAADTDVVTDRSAAEHTQAGWLAAAGYLLGGAALTVGPLAVLGYMLLELGVL